MDIFTQFQKWYADNSKLLNGETRKMQLTIIDNPGWHFIMDLRETHLSDCVFNDGIESEIEEDDWWDFKFYNSKFEAYCGSRKLKQILVIFMDFIEGKVNANNFTLKKYDTGRTGQVEKTFLRPLERFLEFIVAKRDKMICYRGLDILWRGSKCIIQLPLPVRIYKKISKRSILLGSKPMQSMNLKLLKGKFIGTAKDYNYSDLLLAMQDILRGTSTYVFNVKKLSLVEWLEYFLVLRVTGNFENKTRILIETDENAHWKIKIGLKDTIWHNESDVVLLNKNDAKCNLKDNIFEALVSPNNLLTALNIFRKLIEGTDISNNLDCMNDTQWLGYWVKKYQIHKGIRERIHVHLDDKLIWHVEINLRGTNLENRVVPRCGSKNSKLSWHEISVRNNIFKATGTFNSLLGFLQTFRDLIENTDETIQRLKLTNYL